MSRGVGIGIGSLEEGIGKGWRGESEEGVMEEGEWREREGRYEMVVRVEVDGSLEAWTVT